LATTSVTMFELYYGAYRTGRKKNIDAAEELSKRVNVFEFTKKSAKLAGKILA